MSWRSSAPIRRDEPRHAHRGAHQFPFGKVKLVPAFHGGRVDGDETGKYTTNPPAWS